MTDAAWQIAHYQSGGGCPYQLTGKLSGQNIPDYYFYLRARWDEVRTAFYATAADLEQLDDSTCVYTDAIYFKDGLRAGYINRQQAYSLLHFFIEGFYHNPLNK